MLKHKKYLQNLFQNITLNLTGVLEYHGITEFSASAVVTATPGAAISAGPLQAEGTKKEFEVPFFSDSGAPFIYPASVKPNSKNP